MASIIRELHVTADADAAWDALRDYGNVHRRVARGFVTDTRTDGDDRVVTFANGSTVRWITDVLPDAAGEPIGAMMDAGAAAIMATLA